MGLFGHHGVFSKVLGGNLGHWLNSALGTSESAKMQYENQLKLQNDAQNFSKWQMANSHQMEVKDLQNAGLNPILSANAGASSGGVTEGSASAGTSAGDPAGIITAIVGSINNSKQTNAMVKKTKADITNETNQTTANVDLAKAEKIKAMKEAGFTAKQIEYYDKYGVFPGATTTTSSGYSGGGSALWGAGSANASYNSSKTVPVGLKAPSRKPTREYKHK